MADPAATVNFYTAFFGPPAAKIRRGYAKYVLDKPALRMPALSALVNVARWPRRRWHGGPGGA